MKYITVKLTAHQAIQAIESLENDAFEHPDPQVRGMIKRIATKLRKSLAQAKS